MVAPILKRDTNKRRVFFPYIGEEQHWEHIFTGKKITVDKREGVYKWVYCPLGTPAAFKRQKATQFIK